jgi:hypothetical protein
MITFEDRDELAPMLDRLAAMEAPAGERPNRGAVIRRAIRREVDETTVLQSFE